MSMMNTTTGASSSSTSTSTTASPPPSPCVDQGGAASMERARYFSRQLLTADDLTADQQHVLAKLRRHNRYLHGWGVVCGGGVRAVSNYTVVVEPGYLLGPQGDEIVIDRCVQVDLSQQGIDGNATSPCVTPVDPWCATTKVDLRVGQQLFIAAAYAECLSRPVRVQPAGCGCDDAGCEYSRLRDGFVIRVLSSLPDSYSPMAPPINPRMCVDGGVRPCPACIDNPWVLLASVTIRGNVIRDHDIDNTTYRRNVISFADDYVLCGPKLSSLVVAPPAVMAGGTAKGTVTLDRPAPQGDSFVQLQNSDSSSATVPESVTVPAGQTTAPFDIVTTIAATSGTITISAILLSVTKTATLGIVTLSGLEIAPSAAEVGDKGVVGTVTLSAPAPTAQTASISVDNSSVASTSAASLPIAANATSAPFPVTVSGAGLATFTALLDGMQKSATLAVLSLTSVSIGNGKTLAGQTVTGTVTITGNVPAGGLAVTIKSSNTSVANATSATVTVLPATTGNPTGTFTVKTFKGGSVVFTAALGTTQSVQGSLEVVGLKSFTASPTSLAAGTTDGNTSTGVVTLTDTAPIAAPITLAATGSSAGLLTVPANVTVAVGQSSNKFTMSTPNGFTDGKVPVTATLAGDTLSVTITVQGAPR